MTLILDTNILIALYRIYLVYGSRAVKNKWLKLLIKHDALEIWIPRTVLKEFTPYPPEKGKKFISLLRKLCNTSGIKFTICPIHNKHAILTLTLDLDIELGEADGIHQAIYIQQVTKSKVRFLTTEKKVLSLNYPFISHP